MNYSKWLRTEYPELKDASKEKTCDLINEAKKNSSAYLLLNPLVIFGITYIFYKLLTSYNYFSPLQGNNSWLWIFIFICIASFFSTKIIHIIIKKELKKILENS